MSHGYILNELAKLEEKYNSLIVNMEEIYRIVGVDEVRRLFHIKIRYEKHIQAQDVKIEELRNCLVAFGVREEERLEDLGAEYSGY